MCENVYYDMVVKIVKVFLFMVKEIIEKGWNVVFFIIDKVDVEEERIKILKYFFFYGFDVYNVLKLGKIVFVNVRKNNLKDIEYYLCE